MNSSHSLIGCSITLATVTLGAAGACTASGVRPQALSTTTAKAARGKRKGLSEWSMENSANVLVVGGV
ncbi:hypothetical protein D3C73_1654890 [compost metagenome]